MSKKYGLLLSSFLIFLYSFVYPASIKSIGSGNWNDASIWEGNAVPTAIDDVTIDKGYTVYIDTWVECKAGSLVVETGGSVIFTPTDFAGSTLTVYGSITFKKDSNIIISPTYPNSYAYLKAQDVTLDEDANFLISLSSPSNYVTVNLKSITITKANFQCYYFNSGKINLFIDKIINYGLFEIVNFTNIVHTIVVNKIKNYRIMRFKAPDPAPANFTKPDPETTERKLKLIGIPNNSYILTIRADEYTLPVSFIMENVYVENVGIWRGIDEETKLPIYGIGFIGGSNPIDGRYDSITVYNCDINNSYDTGIYFKNCKRINENWGQISISSNIIRGCVTAGIWLMQDVEKCDIKYNKIYNNIGGNIGYGILLGNPISPVVEQPSENITFTKENKIYNNEIYNNKIRGIYLFYSHKNLIDSNKCYGHIEEGISLKNSLKNVVILNECYNNGVHGIALDGIYNNPLGGSKHNYIGNNKCFNNGNGGLRVRYNSNQNIFVNNISTGNARTALTSHSSVGNLFVSETYYGNGWGDIYVEGEENQGYISQLWLKNCLLGSATEFVNTPEKQEFTKEGSYVFSQCHDRIPGLVRIWGQFVFPDTYHTWHTNDTLKFNYAEPLYISKSHGWNSVVNTYDTPMLRYDDGGIDGPGGSNDITSVTITTATKTEVWIISYDTLTNKWIARGTVSGVQTKLVAHDTDYESEGGEIKFRLTHRISPISPGEEYVFVTIQGSNDKNIQKVVQLCDFSDAYYIGSYFNTTSKATLEIKGTQNFPTIFTRKLAEDKIYQIISGTEDFYYGLSFGGIINKIEYASFTFLNSDGIKFYSSPLKNTENIFISRIQPSSESSYITTENVNHTFDNVILDTYTASLGVVNYSVKAKNSVLTFRNYFRPYLLDKLENSIVYWNPTIVWAGLSGFTEDGVEPNSINRLNSVEFVVKYIDLNNTPPTTIQVWVDLDDDLIFSSTEQFGLRLKPGVNNDGNYTNGEIYHCVLSHINYPNVPSIGKSGGKIKYRFYAENPYIVTISTYSYNLYSVFNNMLSKNEVTGIARNIQTFAVKGTPPVVKVETPVGKQTDLVKINYTLYDYDDKPEPYNYCSVKVEYFDGTTWRIATRHSSSEELTNLLSTLDGVNHYFIWDSKKDLPNKDMPTKIRITPTDEDGEGSIATTSSFQLDNIVATQLVFKTPSEELKIGATSQLIIVEAQDELGNKDVDVNTNLYLITTSTKGAFLNQAGVVVSSISMISGEARFYYRDEIAGNPVISVYSAGLSPAQQSYYVTKYISVIYSSVSVLVGEELSYADLPVGNTVTLVITLKDIENLPVVGKEVVVYASGSDFILTQPQSPTNLEGKTYATIFTTKAEKKTITAKVKDDNLVLLSSVTLNFYPLDPSEEKSTLVVSKNKAIVGEKILVIVTLIDKYGNIVSSASLIGPISVSIKVENQPVEDILVMLSTYTDVFGTVRAEYTGNVEGLKLFTAYTNKITLLSTATVQYTSGDITPPSVVSISPANNSVLTEPISQIVVQLEDSSGISLSSSSFLIYGPNDQIIEGNLSLSGNTLIFSFPQITTDGQYIIEIIAADTKGNTQNYTYYFTLQTQDPQKVFNSSLKIYPNPSSTGKTTMRYSLLNNSEVKIKIYNILGEIIWEKSFEDQAGNDKILEWFCENSDKTPVGSGVYIVTIKVKDKVLNREFITTKKQVVIKK